MLPGKIATLLVIATALSVIGALLVAWRYRAAMQALMKAPLAAAPGASEAPAARLPYAADVAPIPVTLADNRQAERRLILAFLGETFAPLRLGGGFQAFHNTLSPSPSVR